MRYFLQIGCEMKNPINVTTLKGKNYYTDNNNQPYSGPYIEFHKNGNKSEEGSVKNGKKDVNAGMKFYYKNDDIINRGDVICRIFSNDINNVQVAEKMVEESILIKC